MKFLRIFMILVFFNFVFNIGVKSKNKNDDNIVYVSVNGLVCDFCARSIEKMFEKKEAVSRISVDLENMLITIFLRDNQKLNEAVKLFSEVIEIDPYWAEAWNKRATVFFLLGEFQKSQNDIDKVLELEKRHFGALAGQGLVNIHLKNYEKAILSYKKAQKIYPAMKSPKIMIKEIEELIKKQSI